MFVLDVENLRWKLVLLTITEKGLSGAISQQEAFVSVTGLRLWLKICC